MREEREAAMTSGLAPVQGEIDLLEVGAILWRGWLSIVAAVVIASVLSVLVALSLPDIYRATIVLAPAEDGDAAGGLLAQTGQLASLAGLSLGLEKPVDKTALALEVLQSRQFFNEFASRRPVLVPLYATERWDADARELVIDPEVYDPGTEKWTREPVDGRGPEPSLLDAHERFLDLLEVERASDTGFVRLSMEHQSPVIAHEWLTWIVGDLNERIRRKDTEEAERSIAFLGAQVEQTPLAEIRAVLFQLIQSQTEKMMLARVRDEYVFETIDPSFLPERKSRPNRVLLCIAGAIFGGLFGVVWVLVKSAVRSRTA